MEENAVLVWDGSPNSREKMLFKYVKCICIRVVDIDIDVVHQMGLFIHQAL